MRYKDTYWKEIERAVFSIPEIRYLYNKKIIITGCTGMICSVIVEFLFLLNQKYKSGIHAVKFNLFRPHRYKPLRTCICIIQLQAPEVHGHDCGHHEICSFDHFLCHK